MNDLNLNFAPNIIYAHFEQAIHSAVVDIFPDVIRKGCRFVSDNQFGEKFKVLVYHKFLKINLKL